MLLSTNAKTLTRLKDAASEIISLTDLKDHLRITESDDHDFILLTITAVRIAAEEYIQSNGITADSMLVGAFRQAGTIYDRESVIVELSDSDDDNFTKNLITVRAERRLALTIEQPSHIIGGDLTPA